MFPASCKSGGMCLAVPDVCKVPAPPTPFIPTPFPNTAQVAQCTGTSTKVKIDGSEAVMKGSSIPMSAGDEPGTLGGVKSAKFKGDALFNMGSMKVKVEGKQLCRQTSIVGQNGGSNANHPAGVNNTPSQSKVTCP
jgi:uncharacterized Zn-binding protein involved in type VI secretion